MIEKMSKVRILGLKKDKEKLLDSIFISGLFELKESREFDSLSRTQIDTLKEEEIIDSRKRFLSAIEFIENIKNTKMPKEEIFLTRNDVTLVDIKRQEKELEEVECIIDALREIDEQKRILARKREKFVPFVILPLRLSGFKGTKTTDMFLGKIKDEKALDLLKEDLKEFKYVSCEVLGEVIQIFAHKSESQKVKTLLENFNFEFLSELPDKTASEVVQKLDKEIAKLDDKKSKYIESASAFLGLVKSFKIIYDYLGFLLAKIQANEKFMASNYTFFVEGYLRQKDENKAKEFLDKLGVNVSYEFLKIDKTDDAPTALSNNLVVRPFEFITNTYSVPSPKALDPNLFIAIFFSIFFGFVMADIGYGLLFIIFCMPMYFVIRGSTKSLMGILSICGVTTIIFGALFGSFFGLTHETLALIPEALIKDPTENVYLMLAICLGAGIVQIAVSYILKGVLFIKRKEYGESIFSGFIWVLFFIGVIIFALSFVAGDNLRNIGLILGCVSLFSIVVGQFFINKGINRLTKPFSSVYSIINILSDTLSYARLYGLMLSGAIISSIVNDLASPFFSNGLTFTLGIIILLIGHGFNLFMGALSAYIHVSRLQYIEFFSRFYEGEGRLFTPFASKFSYINLIEEKNRR